jgi:hypothetical protein
MSTKTSIDHDLLTRHLRELAAFLAACARGRDRPAVSPELEALARPRWATMLEPAHAVALFTRLCALRAGLRGRLHFAPRTDLARAHWVLGVPCKGDWTPATPGSWSYRPIDLALQAEWSAPLLEVYRTKITA